MIWVSTGASFGPGKSSLHETVLRELGFARECANTHDRSSLGICARTICGVAGRRFDRAKDGFGRDQLRDGYRRWNSWAKDA